MISPIITVIGAAHVDQTIYLEGPVRLGRTNPASHSSIAGGVAANIARHMASGAISLGRSGALIQFLGVTNSEQGGSLQRDLQTVGIKARFVALAGPAPSYTAILDPDGELVIGAACMDLYDAVTADDILPFIPKTGCVVMDANFPKVVLGAAADALPVAMSLFAAGTSVEKVRRLLPIMDRLDGLVLNRAEAAQLVADGSTAEMAQRLAVLMRPRGFVLVSDGADVAALAQDGIVVERAPQPLETTGPLKSVNGAGDAMAARLFALYLQGASRHRPSSDMLNDLLQDALAAGAAFAAGESNV